MALHDISVTLHPKMPVWPGSPGIRTRRLMDMAEGAEANGSEVSLDVHTGTHIDAPLHFIADGKTTLSIPLQKTVGPCEVLYFPNKSVITAEDLANSDIPLATKKLLFKTDNSQKWADPQHAFDENFCALSADAAQWVADRGIELVGIDYHSIQKFHDSMETHRILLRAEIVILETLNLSEITPGPYRLICLPLKVHGVEGISARAILEDL